MVVLLASAIICILLCLAYLKLNRVYKYWEAKGVKGPKPQWLIGNLLISKKEYSIRELAMRYYDQYPKENVVGLYQGLAPTLLIRNPEFLKRILIQDFGAFVNRGFIVLDGPLSKNLFEQDGDNWRLLRQKMTPIFTTGKLKQMMPLLSSCVKEYINHIEKVIDKDALQEMRELNTKYTTKTITTVGFGLDIDVFNESSIKFIQMVNKLMEPNRRILVTLLKSILPGIGDKLITLVKPEITNYFISTINQIVNQRQGKVKTRHDFMDLMIQMKEEGTIIKAKESGVTELNVTEEIIAAQALLFYVAGFDTSSATMAFLLYELACNTAIQDRCYEEIKQTMEKCNDELLYESLSELKYLSMVFKETLRKYPIGAELFRESVSVYTFPGTDLTIDKGTKILIPVYSIHNDPQYFPQPEKFDPERFAPENIKNIQDCTYIPFGDGPRNCIGMRFATVQSLLGIANFLFKFRVETSEKTMKSFKYDPNMLTLTSAEGIWLNVKRR